MSRFSDKIAVVTGAAQGIGFSIAESLVKAGVKGIALLDIDYNSVKSLADSINEKKTTRAIAYECDVSNCEAVESVFAGIISEFGKVDILVNNAAIIRDRMFHKMSVEQWNAVINVNLNGAFYCTRCVINGMRERNYGRIVNISSTSSYGNIGQANYSAAKAGIIGFTKTLARENARKGITVNAVAPDFINTPMMNSIPEDQLNELVKSCPMQRMGEPEEVAALVTFLCSEEASYVSGTCIDCSGAKYT